MLVETCILASGSLVLLSNRRFLVVYLRQRVACAYREDRVKISHVGLWVPVLVRVHA